MFSPEHYRPTRPSVVVMGRKGITLIFDCSMIHQIRSHFPILEIYKADLKFSADDNVEANMSAILKMWKFMTSIKAQESLNHR